MSSLGHFDAGKNLKIMTKWLRMKIYADRSLLELTLADHDEQGKKNIGIGNPIAVWKRNILIAVLITCRQFRFSQSSMTTNYDVKEQGNPRKGTISLKTLP